MNYTEMLNRIIERSQLKGVDIINKCKEMDAEITPNYLSVLRNADGKIPSEKVSLAIAKACDATRPDILLIQACLDKAPQKVLSFMEQIYEGSKETVKLLFKNEHPNRTDEEIQNEIEKAFEEITLADFICDYAEDNMKLSLPITLNTASETQYAVVPLKHVKFATDEQIQKLGLD